MTRRTFGAVASAALVVCLSTAHGGESGLPKEVKGFSGQVRGRMTGKGNLNRIKFQVAEVVKVWPANRAKNPQALKGLTIVVAPRVTEGDEAAEKRPVPLHVTYLNKLKAGQEAVLDLKNRGGRYVFRIEELTKEQRLWATGKLEQQAQREESKALKVLRGFEGQVSGTVVDKPGQGRFAFRAAQVTRVWPGNKAERPKALAGRTITVGPPRPEGGLAPPIYGAFIRKLTPGQKLTLELRLPRTGTIFRIMELTKEQREWVRAKKPKRPKRR
jgi:hypothetical protein